MSSIFKILANLRFSVQVALRRLLPPRNASSCCMFLGFRNGTALMQTIDFGRAKSELLENLIVVFSNLWSALRGYLGDAKHLKRAADGGRQLATGAVERNDDVIRPKLGIVDHFLRPTHCSERHVDTVEHLVPMVHRARRRRPRRGLP